MDAKGTFDIGNISDISDSEIDREISDMQPVNTKKQTQQGLRKFEDWLKRRPSLEVNLREDSEDKIAPVLRKFYIEVRIEVMLKMCSLGQCLRIYENILTF